MLVQGAGGVNPGIEAGAVGWGAERAGKQFHVGFTPDGRIVHLYGNDVAKGSRRQVLSRSQSLAAAKRLGITLP